MTSRIRCLLFLIAVLSAHSPRLLAQTGLATLTGTVTDQTGAVVPNVQVKAVHVDTGFVLTGTTSTTGNYTISQMPIGRYQISVETAGFKTFRREGISLAAAQTLRIDVAMEVGATSDSVTVNADASLLKTESGEVVHNITVSQMQNLPLMPVNGSGGQSAFGFRDPYAVALLIPGVQYTASTTMVINGTPNASAQYRIEGQVSGLTSALAAFTHFTQPSVDAVQEVAIQTSNFAAEFGSVGGGIFNVTMKSGTNQFHGSAYDYMVNEVTNAAHPFTHLRNRDRRNDWGFTVGGPVRIPKLYDGRNKTFFFWSFEQFRTNSIITTTSPSVPTEAFRKGDFSALIPASGVNGVPRPLLVGTGAAQRNYVDPLGNNSILAGTIFDPRSGRPVACNTGISPDCPAGSTVQYRTAFPGNQIPASYFDNVALKVQALVPLPLGANSLIQLGNNYQRPWPAPKTSNLPSFKIDHMLTQAARLSFFWSMDKTNSQYSTPNGAYEGFPDTITGARATFHYSKTARLNYDHTVTPSILLHFGLGWTQLNFLDNSPTLNYNAEKELGLKGATLNRNFPNFNVCGAAGCAANTGGMSTLGPAAQTTGSSERRPSVTLNATWVKSNHTVKIGGEWLQNMYPTQVWTNTAGNYMFSGNGWSVQSALQPVTLSQGTTGFGYAQFLMGNVTGVTLALPITYRTSKQQWGLFLQDTWKVTRKLTLDYGVRWDLGTYTREDYGRNGNLSLSVPNSSAGGHPGGLIFEATCKCNFASNYPYAIGPRLGFAYSYNSKTVIRGGVGVVYTTTGVFGGSISNDVVIPVGSQGFGEGLFQLQDGIPASINPQWPVFDAAVGHPANQVVASPAMLDPNGGRPARQLQWSLGVQREVTRNLVVEASYVANRGVWWPAPNLTSYNDITDPLLAKYGFQSGNTADRALLIAQVGSLTATQKSTLQARGVNLPYTGFPGTQTVRQSIRPFPQYNTSINPNVAPLGKTWYDSLQLTVTKRYSHGLTLNANYTFSKNLQLMNSPDVFNRQLGKNLSPNDLPHQIRISAEYQVPRLRESTPVVGNRIVSYVLGGWGLGVYLQYQSAGILGRPAPGSAQPISDWLNRGPCAPPAPGTVAGCAQLKLGADGKPMSPWAVNWTDYDGKVHPEPLDINCHCYDPARTVVLNPAAWEGVPNGQWANDYSDIRYFRGIRRPQENANFSRNFRFKEGRMSLQVRVEMNNVFNRTLLPSPLSLGQNFGANPTASGGIFTAGFGTFGNLTGATAGLGAQRSGQLIGRFTF